MVKLHLAAWGNGAVVTYGRAQHDRFCGEPLAARVKAVVCESTDRAEELRELATTHGIKAKVALVAHAQGLPPGASTWGEQLHFAA
eukprot:1751455-Alexandrium_andersonii.AAC.1